MKVSIKDYEKYPWRFNHNDNNYIGTKDEIKETKNLSGDFRDYVDVSIETWEKLVSILEESELSLDQISESSDMPVQYINSLLKRHNEIPSVKTIVRLCSGLGYNVSINFEKKE